MNEPSRKIPPAAAVREAFRDFPIVDADACVKCGLCLPHCPTYSLNRNEGDSPRGRIALLQGLAQGELEPDDRATEHLDGCLTCRACERVCPAQVPYGSLIDAGRRSLWRTGHRPGRLWRMLAFLRRTPTRLRWLARLIRLLDRSGLSRLLARLPLKGIARLNDFITSSGTAPAAGTYRPRGAIRGEVGLFLGCIARPLDAAVANATIRTLNRMGFAVVIPAIQGCCGAMDAHAGDEQAAAAMAQRNLAAFSDKLDAIVTTASGCGVQLMEYDQLPGVKEDAGNSTSRVCDVMTFIHTHRDALPPLTEINARVAVHSPCTLRNGMQSGGALELLRSIPGIQASPLAHAHCCGAAGSYLFEHPESSDALGNALLDSLDRDNLPDTIVTSNIGCALHVERLARQRRLPLTVCHPVELLARSLNDE